jgi:hypothetical protein
LLAGNQCFDVKPKYEDFPPQFSLPELISGQMGQVTDGQAKEFGSLLSR